MDRDRLARRHEQHKRYYAKTAFKYKPREWTVVEDKMVLAHAIPDSELSEIIRRSMKAISNRRWRLKRAEGTIMITDTGWYYSKTPKKASGSGDKE